MFFRCHICFSRIFFNKDRPQNYTLCPACGAPVGVENFAPNFHILRNRFPKPYYAEADND